MIGAQLSPYRVEELLGESALGQVYRAVHVQLGRQVVLRRILPGLLPPAAARSAWYASLTALTRLQHPHLVTLYDYFENERGLFLVTEYAEGEPLDQYVAAHGALTPARSRSVMTQLLSALAYAHGRGVVHGNLRPANVRFTTDGQVRLFDCGLAPLLRSQGSLAPTEVPAAALVCLSPEQLQGAPASVAGDVYGAGVLLYLLLTGRLPYQTDQPSDYELMRRIVSDPLPPATAAPPALAAALRRATDKEPDRRFADAEAFRAALRDEKPPPEKETPPVVAVDWSLPPGERRQRAVRRQGLWLALLMLSTVAVAMFFIFRAYDPHTTQAARQQVEQLFQGLNNRDPEVLTAVFAPVAERYYQHADYPIAQIQANYRQYWRRVPSDNYTPDQERILITSQNDGTFDVTVPTRYQRLKTQVFPMYDPATQAYESVRVYDTELREIDFRIRLNEALRVIYFREQRNVADPAALRALLTKRWRLSRFSQAGIRAANLRLVDQLRNRWQQLTRTGTIAFDPDGNFERTMLLGEDTQGTWTYEAPAHLITLQTTDQVRTWRVMALNDTQLIVQYGDPGREETLMYEAI